MEHLKAKRRSISQEEIDFIIKFVGKEKFNKRLKEFEQWIKVFVSGAQKRGKFPADARFFNDTVEETSLILNTFFWLLIEQAIRPKLTDYNTSTETIVNHYKMAATAEYVVMKCLPFEDSSGDIIISLNAELAFSITLQILFNWNVNTDGITVEKLTDLVEKNEPTKAFLKEHLAWLNNHCTASQEIIFSNMQTMRLFHYWFREPKHVKGLPEKE